MRTILIILFLFILSTGYSQPKGVKYTPPSSALTMTADVEAEQTVSILVIFTGSLTVDWGDGSEPEAMVSSEETPNTHEYASADAYEISITGDLTALTALGCSENSLTSLDVSSCTALTGLGCYNNSLTSLDMSSCTALTYLDCSANPIVSLDVSGCSLLTFETFIYTGLLTTLTTLDLTACTRLSGVLDLSGGIIESLTLTGCSGLTSVFVYENNMTESAITATINSMYDRTETSTGYYAFTPMNETFPQTLTEGQTNALTAKNWAED